MGRPAPRRSIIEVGAAVLVAILIVSAFATASLTTRATSSATAATAAAAATATPSPTPAFVAASRIRIVRNVLYTALVDCGSGITCQVPADVYIPAGSGPFPTVVLLRGGPGGIGGRSYIASFADQLAADGILVYSIDVRDLADHGGGYPQAMQDTACAIRHARATAAAYGGDNSTVTLVGHSFGAYIGSVVALNSTEYTGGCPYGGSGRPDAFVGLAGCYDVAGGGNHDDFADFFGGYADATADVRAVATPFHYALGSSIPVRLVAGTDDATVDPVASSDLYDFLRAKGWDVVFVSADGQNHSSILDAAHGETAITDAISVATARSQSSPSGLAGSQAPAH